jgi:hypothetical protein
MLRGESRLSNIARGNTLAILRVKYALDDILLLNKNSRPTGARGVSRGSTQIYARLTRHISLD